MNTLEPDINQPVIFHAGRGDPHFGNSENYLAFVSAVNADGSINLVSFDGHGVVRFNDVKSRESSKFYETVVENSDHENKLPVGCVEIGTTADTHEKIFRNPADGKVYLITEDDAGDKLVKMHAKGSRSYTTLENFTA